jgi:methionyl-tRNA synthetase
VNKTGPDRKNFYITTAIDYVNAVPHIGTAYEKIGADVLARFKRLDGWNVRFLMGNDEHSLNVKKAAESEGMDPLSYCDRMDGEFRAVWRKLQISFDDFIRTTEARHVRAVQKLLQAMYDRGDIYRAEYEGWYCNSCEAFLKEKDLVDGKCPNHQREPEWIAEKNYFFALSKYRDRLLDHIRKHPEFIMPEIRRNEIVSLLKEGLEDISISRATRDWGIPFTFDPDHMIYVWIDALINYVSAVGYATDQDLFDEWWPADVHVIGKDITRFHCVIWPSMLLSAGLELPNTVFGHGFVYQKGQRMSKTLGNIVDPLDVVDRFGPDPLRFYLMRDGSWGRDSDFTWEHFIRRYNTDLANDLGNLLSRTTGMVSRYQNDTVLPPEPSGEADRELEEVCLKESARYVHRFNEFDDDLETHNIITGIWNIVHTANRYVDSQAAWVLHREGKSGRIATILYHLVETLRMLGILLSPFMPDTSRKIWHQLGLEELTGIEEESTDSLKSWGLYPAGTRISPGKALFPKIDAASDVKSPTGEIREKTVKPDPERKEKKMAEEKESQEEIVESKENFIDFSEFQRIDLRTATVVRAEKVPETDRLISMEIQLGDETRTIVAGIGEQYTPEEVTGKDVVVVTNLQPRRIRGIESQGMILAAEDGRDLGLLTVDRKMKSGLKIS